MSSDLSSNLGGGLDSNPAAPFDWTTVAGAWGDHSDHIERTKRATTQAMLRRLDARPGEEILELAAGTGAFTMRLAEAVGPQGRVVASDAAQGMVDLIERRTSGNGTIDVQTIDAQRLPFDAEAFDAVACRMGYMFVPDKATALREARRCLRPGGRLVLATWAGPQHNAWALCLGMAAMQHGVAPPGDLFSLAEETQIGALLAQAGFDDVTVEQVDTPFVFESFAEYWDIVPRLAGPLADTLARRTDEERTAIREAARALTAPHQSPTGLRLPGRALVTLAR